MAAQPTRSALKVLFCGQMMRAGFQFTRDAAQRAGLTAALQISECSGDELQHEIRDAHVAVPLMSRLDDAMMAAAPKLRMILQFGVGLEGVDVDAVRYV